MLSDTIRNVTVNKDGKSARYHLCPARPGPEPGRSWNISNKYIDDIITSLSFPQQSLHHDGEASAPHAVPHDVTVNEAIVGTL